MRISAWSSDVCSSDLSGDIDAGMLRQVAGLTDSKPDPMAFLDGGATEQKPPDAPEVLLVGTGLKQRLLAPQVTTPLLQLGIGVESSAERRVGKWSDSTCRHWGSPNI